MQTETLIIGGGLAGLALANALKDAGKDYLLVEARDRLGGRILGASHGDAVFDLGPMWFWHGQPRIAALVARFGLERFDQFARGDLVYEDQNGVQRGQGFASMEGSFRLAGGIGVLIEALASSLPTEKVVQNSPVTRIVRKENAIDAHTLDQTFTAQRIVMALPPRIAAKVAFQPVLPSAALPAMQSIPTWMAGQAKAVAVFESPFWREANLSGDGMSRIGPMVEIHDASPKTNGPYALFGFIGVPPAARRDESILRSQIVAQLGRLFGPQGEAPIKLMIKDWAFDPHTSTDADLIALSAHPRYGLPASLKELWDGNLLFAGSEAAPQFGGYLEGALEAAELAFMQLNRGE